MKEQDHAIARNIWRFCASSYTNTWKVHPQLEPIRISEKFAPPSHTHLLNSWWLGTAGFLHAPIRIWNGQGSIAFWIDSLINFGDTIWDNASRGTCVVKLVHMWMQRIHKRTILSFRWLNSVSARWRKGGRTPPPATRSIVSKTSLKDKTKNVVTY